MGMIIRPFVGVWKNKEFSQQFQILFLRFFLDQSKSIFTVFRKKIVYHLFRTYPTQLTQPTRANANETKAISGVARFIFFSLLIWRDVHFNLNLCLLPQCQIVNWLMCFQCKTFYVTESNVLFDSTAIKNITVTERRITKKLINTYVTLIVDEEKVSSKID